MKKILSLSFILIAACNSAQKTVKDAADEEKSYDPIPYAASITEDELKAHLYVYASDEFEGRETGKPGQKKAIAYLKKAYEDLNIPAAKANGDYFQAVPLEVASVPTGNITLNGTSHTLGDGIISFTAAEGTYSDIVYLGYGIEDKGYSDYDGLDVTGKIVLIKAGEPKDESGNYVISGSLLQSKWSNMSEGIGKKSKLAVEKGAIGVLYVDAQNFARYEGYFNFMKNNQSGRMSLTAETSANFLIMLKTNIAQTLVPEIETENTPKTLDSEVVLNITSGNKAVNSENVAAIIKGSEKPNEYIVISSHLDHIGVTASGQINNGADDDGSGSVALLEIAEAFKKAKADGFGPKRSIIFLHVTGEEKGLLGSKYYTDYDPIVPLEQTVANLNIDMIGRIDPKREGNRNYIYLIGSDKLSTDLHELSEAVNAKYMNIELDYTYNDDNDPNRFYYRSDHYNFAKNNIPIIFYFNGTHPDYHQPGDTPDKINYDFLENRTRLVFHTAWELANRPEKVVVDKATK